jgi:hypothetical protein
VARWRSSAGSNRRRAPPRRAAADPANYGFIGLTNPDPAGTNGQGADTDANIAGQAVQWLQRNSKSESPYCLTASFVNPHDKQFFWAGSEADRYYPTFDGKPYKPYIAQYRPVPSEENRRRSATRRCPETGSPTPTWSSTESPTSRRCSARSKNSPGAACPIARVLRLRDRRRPRREREQARRSPGQAAADQVAGPVRADADGGAAAGIVARDLEARTGELSRVLSRDERVHVQPADRSGKAQDGARIRRVVLTVVDG